MENLNEKRRIDYIRQKVESIQSKVADSKMESALEMFLDLAKGEKLKAQTQNGIMLNARFKSNKKSMDRGIIEWSSYARELANIGYALLNFLGDAWADLQEKYQDDQETDTDPKPPVEKKKESKKILFLASSPSNIAKLELEKEFVQIFNSLREFENSYELAAEWAVSPNALQLALLKHQPSIIHFAGHGSDNDEASQKGGIYLTGPDGEAVLAPSSALSSLLKIAIRRGSKIELVVLNACSTAQQAAAICDHVSNVIGISGKISDEGAINFATGLYRGLAQEEDFCDAFDLAINLLELSGILDDKPMMVCSGCD